MFKYPFIGRIETNFEGFRQLASFYTHCHRNYENCEIEIDLTKLTWIDANLCGLWLAMLRNLQINKGLRFKIDSIFYQNTARQEAKFNILLRNGFIQSLRGMDELLTEDWDERKSTIPIRTFTIEQVDDFVNYIEQSFLNHQRCRISDIDKDRLQSAYFELFSNYEIHSKTSAPVYVCGQFFPKTQKLIFTMTDLGIGFHQPIQTYLNRECSAIDTIKWAIRRGNTTKKEARGGSGLSDIDEFCQTNKGDLHIITDNIYTQYNYHNSSRTFEQVMGADFAGTTVHLIFPIQS